MPCWWRVGNCSPDAFLLTNFLMSLSASRILFPTSLYASRILFLIFLPLLSMFLCAGSPPTSCSEKFLIPFSISFPKTNKTNTVSYSLTQLEFFYPFLSLHPFKLLSTQLEEREWLIRSIVFRFKVGERSDSFYEEKAIQTRTVGKM